MARWMGVDYGTRRIGLAISDPQGRIASAVRTIAAGGKTDDDVHAVQRAATDYEADGIVVGMPVNMDGTIGPQAKLTESFAARLRAAATVPVECWDERLSTFQADQWLLERKLTASRRKQRRDALAAQAILQSFLDARCEAPRDRDEDPPNRC